jgi:hypothetical protein
MHRYQIEIDGRSFAVDVQDQDADRYAVCVEGQTFDVVLADTQELQRRARHV